MGGRGVNGLKRKWAYILDIIFSARLIETCALVSGEYEQAKVYLM